MNKLKYLYHPPSNRLLLPEEDFGTQYQHMISYDALYSHMNPGIHIDGLNNFSDIVFGSQIQVVQWFSFLKCRHKVCNFSVKLQHPQDEGRTSNPYVPLSHPFYISELFTQNGKTPAPIKLKYTEAGLAKLLLFSTFIRTRSQSKMGFIATELKKYPYTTKKELKVEDNRSGYK